jgi:hypothetical protein
MYDVTIELITRCAIGNLQNMLVKLIEQSEATLNRPLN